MGHSKRRARIAAKKTAPQLVFLNSTPRKAPVRNKTETAPLSGTEHSRHPSVPQPRQVRRFHRRFRHIFRLSSSVQNLP